MRLSVSKYAFPAVLTFIVFAYVCYRSAVLSITHDEVLSYSITQGNDLWKGTANDHWLNTSLMGFTAWIFGPGEWALRLPNVLAFLLYAYAAYRICYAQPNNRWIAAAFFSLLICNQLSLDFFGLARGYGLALAFFTWALSLFPVRTSRSRWRFFLAVVLCFYSNFSFLIPLFGLVLLHFLYGSEKDRAIRKRSLMPLVPYFLLILALLPGVVALYDLAESGQLYIGREEGFKHATLYSFMIMAQSWLNDFSWGLDAFVYFLMATVLLGIGHYQKRSILVPAVVLLFYWIAVESFFHFKGVLYPVQRSVIFLFPLCMLLWSELAQRFWQAGSRYSWAGIAMILLTVPGGLYSFYTQSNTHSTINFRGDADVKKVLSDLADNHDEAQVSLGMPWYLEPAMCYYKERDQLDWLVRPTRDGIQSRPYDYYFMHDRDTTTLDSFELRRVEHYPVSGFSLFRNHGKKPQ